MVLAAFCVAESHLAYAQIGLSPQDFNKMYYLASQGKIGILREAVNRGLNIDSVNPHGDTGLCIAIKRNNTRAYNSFRMSGANPHHACTYRIYKEYQAFLANERAASAERIVGNQESLYYDGKDWNLWPWILGGAAIGGGIWALTHKSGGHHSQVASSSSGGEQSEQEKFEELGYGLAGYVTNYTQKISSGSVRNTATIDASNPNASTDSSHITFLPNMLSNAPYLKVYGKVMENASYHNAQGGVMNLGDAAIALSAHGASAALTNSGSINVDAANGAIGLVASNGAVAYNSTDDIGVSPDNSSDGSINIIFKGSKEGNSVVGMYADTHSSITNYGKITGIASLAETSGNESSERDNSVFVDDDNMDDDSARTVIAANSGTILGMSLFDYYTGTDVSQNTVYATNKGNIKLQAGHNNASNVSISLIGMGSYLDDRFLNGTSNPLFAEKMLLRNDGLIDLAYQKTYNLSSEALKLGNGGLIGMRADASTGAINHGNINIDMRATNISTGNDVAAGMLSVHGASLVNGTAGSAYNGNNATGGMIRILNEATSGGVFYGMLAAKGSGTQTSLYKWQPPALYNYGLIDMQVSNSYAMASFAGGEIINDGVINLGQENGQSYYKNNKGLYAAGTDVTEEVTLINRGIINVYSEESAAIENAFSGSVSLANRGTVYISNKATNSKAFAGNYSTAVNYKDILYKVGNSASFSFPSGNISDIGFNVKAMPTVSVINSSGDSITTKQYVDNETNAKIIIGEVRDTAVDYGGTFGTAGIQVSKQGAADNKGTISLVLFDEDISQFNTGMWLDSSATAEAYADNYGDININASNSIGIRNDSSNNASATNYNNINVNGQWGYGMATTATGANIFNGRQRSTDRDAVINVNGLHAIGMYIRNGNAFNYGTINLRNHSTTAFQLDGATASLNGDGNINFVYGLDDVTFYWLTNGATLMFDAGVAESGHIAVETTIDGYTLAKATTDSSGGQAYLSASSAVTVKGENSYLFQVEGNGSQVYNRGNVTVTDGATAIKVSKGGSAYHDGKKAVMTVLDNESVGMAASDSGSSVSTTVSSVLNVEAGTGMYADTIASATNGGTVNVTGGMGMHLIDGNNSVHTTGTNVGTMNVSGAKSIGVKVEDMAQFNNNGQISVSSLTDTADINNYAVGVDSNATVNNTTGGAEIARITVGPNAIGVKGGKVVNGANSEIISNGANSYAIYGAVVENNGKIIVNQGTGVAGSGKFDNFDTLQVNNGIGVSGSVDNYGTIEVNGGVGVQGNLSRNTGTITVYSGYGVVGGGTNSSTITNQGGKAAVKVTGTFTNGGTISGNGIGAEVAGGIFYNQNTITISGGTGIKVESGSAYNRSTINIGNGTGMYIASGASGYNDGGVINLAGSGYGAFVESGGTFVNSGFINYDSETGGTCVSGSYAENGKCVNASEKKNENDVNPQSVSSPLRLENGATFVNNGSVNLNNVDMDFSEGQYVLGENGTYQAASFRGDILASQDIVSDGFDDVYVSENALTGENKGVTATSESYMFEASVEDNGDTSDVKLSRKNFDDLVVERDLATFLETNYKLSNNEKMYQVLKRTSSQNDFNAAVESESGKKFYANLPRENMAILRGIQHGEQKRILEDGLNGASVSANYFRTGKDGNGILSEYADDVYGASFGYGTRLSSGWSMGGTLTASYADSKYDDVDSKRYNTIVMAFMPIMYQNNRFKYLAMPSVGVGYGEYERKAMSNTYKADTFDLYYGLYNHAEYSIDMKVAELVAEAELNLQGINSDTAKEKGGLNLKSNDSVSLEAGIGLKLRKRIELAKQRELMLAIGTKYYHEMLDPYKDLSVGMKYSPVTYHVKEYDEDKNRLRTAAEAMYKDGHFAVSAEIAHNAEKEDSVEGGLGVRYNF